MSQSAYEMYNNVFTRCVHGGSSQPCVSMMSSIEEDGGEDQCKICWAAGPGSSSVVIICILKHKVDRIPV